MRDRHNAIAAIVLAAGQGKRMRSSVPKPLVPLAGRPILRHLLDALEEAGVERVAVVVGHAAAAVRAAVGPGIATPLQAEQLGTGHAVACARANVEDARHVFVVVGDSPLVRAASLRRLLAHHEETGAACSFLTATFERAFPYARVLRDAAGRVTACVEERDATYTERAIRQYLTSHYVFRSDALWQFLPRIEPHAGTDEIYLTEIIAELVADGERAEAVEIDDWRELVGLNTPEDVEWAEGVLAGGARESL